MTNIRFYSTIAASRPLQDFKAANQGRNFDYFILDCTAWLAQVANGLDNKVLKFYKIKTWLQLCKMNTSPNYSEVIITKLKGKMQINWDQKKNIQVFAHSTYFPSSFYAGKIVYTCARIAEYFAWLVDV